MPSSEGEDTTGGMSQAREVLPRPPTLKDWPRGSLTHPVKHVKIRAMNRRSFIRSLVGGAAAALCTWPFRVYSFPTELRILSLDELRRIYVDRAMAEIDRAIANSPLNGVATILCSSPLHVLFPAGSVQKCW